MKLVLILFIVAGQLSAQLKSIASDNQFKPLKTGVANREFVDISRSNWLGTGPRPVRSVIWYPAEKGDQQRY